MIKKIGIEELRKGMYICGMERPGCSPVFLVNDILVKSQDDMDRISGRGYAHIYVAVTDEPSPPVPGGPLAAEGPMAAPACPKPPRTAIAASLTAPAHELVIGPPAMPGPENHPTAADESLQPGPGPRVEFEEEIEEAREIRGEAEQQVREFLRNARLGEKIEPGKVIETVDRMVDSVIRNQDALTSLARLKSFDDYTFAHCVNVCILSLALGRHIGLAKDDLYHIGLGAILHDIGKMLVPAGILNKSGRLTPEEFGVMKRHAELGGEALSGMSCVKGPSLDVVLQHHERYDGSGYYMELSGEGIHLFARIASVADVYDAMTSDRVYQKGMSPEAALKRLYQMRGSLFDPELVERLIKCLGVYPIGTLVELNTGEIALIKMVNHAHPLQPMVLIISDNEKTPRARPFEADLNADTGRSIVGSKKPEHLNAIHRHITA